MSDNLQEWRLVENEEEWDALVEKIQAKLERSRSGKVIASKPERFPFLARADYPNDDKQGPWYPRIEVFDNLELTVELLAAVLRKGNEYLAIVTQETSEDTKEVSITIRVHNFDLSHFKLLIEQ